jgi:hypothetical protein
MLEVREPKRIDFQVDIDLGSIAPYTSVEVLSEFQGLVSVFM